MLPFCRWIEVGNPLLVVDSNYRILDLTEDKQMKLQLRGHGLTFCYYLWPFLQRLVQRTLTAAAIYKVPL